MPSATLTKLNGHELTLTHREKIYFPKDGISKGEVLAYYAGIAKAMVPHIKDHPLMVQRFPNGIGKSGFIQQAAPEHAPAWLRRVSVAKEEGRIEHVVCNNAATLVYLANQGALTFHMWQSRAPKVTFPDRMVFDLDPPDDDFTLACQTAQVFHALLDDLELPNYAMTTGSRGIHVVVPLDQSEPFASVRAFARTLGEWMADKLPDQLTTEQRIAKRGPRLFLDSLRNAYAHTAVAPYSIRAKEGAPVATPLNWDELRGCSINARRYTIKNIFQRLAKTDDPWREMHRKAVGLKHAKALLPSLSRHSVVAGG